MNYLKNAVGLLNAQAPEGEFLAYINPDEAKMLKDAGGSGLLTPQGIPSYRIAYAGQQYSGGSSSSNYSGSGNLGGGGGQDMGSGGGSDNNNNNNNPPSPGDTGGEGGNNPQDNSTTQFNNSFNNNDDIDSTYTDTSFDVTPEPVEKNFFEKVIDFVAGGGVVGNLIQAIGGKLNPKNQYEGITGEDGYGEGDYISNQGDWAASKGYVDESADYYALDLEEQQAIDKMMFDDGVRSQAFSNLYNDGDTSQNNLNNLTSTERNEINKIIPNLPDAIGGTTQQESMVNKYFANTSNNLGISNNFMTSYNQAKADLAKSLNMTSNASQFGYNANMSASNIYYNYLKEQGLL